MNTPALIAGILSLAAFFLHAFVGDREYRVLKPKSKKVVRHRYAWILGRAGWHWLSVDLMLSTVLLFLVVFTNVIQAKQEILFLLGIYFIVCGFAWLTTVIVSKDRTNQILVLGQWILCFTLGGLILWGSQI